MSVSIDAQQEREAYYKSLEPLHMKPLWTVLGNIFTPEPTTEVQPVIWRWKEVRPYLMRSADLITAEEAERRVLMLLNPGLGGRPASTKTLYAGLQLILPGEIAPSHRHSPAALRFIIEGKGAYTSVDGEQTFMEEGDFVLTPNWTWHDHGNTSDRPMVWMDGLDIPLILYLNQIFYDGYEQDRYPLSKPADESVLKFGTSLRPRWEEHDKPHSPVINYKWSRTEQILRSMAQAKQASPYDDVIFEYINPLTGGPAMPTMSGFIQMLRPACETKAHRHTTSAVYCVVRGSGSTIIDGEEFKWQEHDVFVLPPWAEHRHINASSSEEAILFSVTDEAILKRLGLLREKAS